MVIDTNPREELFGTVADQCPEDASLASAEGWGAACRRCCVFTLETDDDVETSRTYVLRMSRGELGSGVENWLQWRPQNISTRQMC